MPCLDISFSVVDNPSLESIDDEKYLPFFKPKFILGLGLRTDATALLAKLLSAIFLPASNICSPAAVYPNGPVTKIRSPFLEPLLVTIFLSAIPKMHTLKTISLPSLVSPPRIDMSYSLHAFLKPVAILSTFRRGIVFGRFTEIIPYLGLTPFAAKSLMHATTLFLAASARVILGGMSVL